MSRKLLNGSVLTLCLHGSSRLSINKDCFCLWYFSDFYYQATTTNTPVDKFHGEKFDFVELDFIYTDGFKAGDRGLK